MARISTYNLDDGISVNDLLLGSSYEGTNNGNPIYATRNYRLSDLAQFFESYDFTNNISLSELDTRLSVVEGYGNHATAGYLTAHPNITAASSVDNSGQFFIQDITLDSNGHILSITSAEAAGGGSSTDLTSFQVLTSAAGTASLTYDNTTGDFTYTPPDLSSYLTSVAFSDLTAKPTTIAGYGITDAFDGAYGSLTGAPDVYTETEINGFFAGTSAITGYSKTNWDSAYNNSITSMTVTGTSTKTITLNQQDGGTVTATFTDISETGSGGITDTNDYVTSGSFSNGTLTLQVQNQSNVSITGFDSRYYTETEVDSLIANYITLTSISTSNSATPSGNGSISYNSGTGLITYTPPDFSGSYLSTSGGTINGDLTISGIINVNSTTGTSNFVNDVSIDGDLSVDGAFTIGTVTGDLRGDVYSIVGATSSVKVLESGSGNTPDTYYIGDLRNSDTDQVFDTSLAMFRKDLKIGDVANDLGGGAENLSLTLGATSFLYFADGAGPTHPTDPYTYIDATKVSTWDSQEEVANMYFYEEGTTDTFRLRLRKQTDSLSRNTSVLIKKGSYMTMSVDDDPTDSYTFGSTTIGALNIGLNYTGLISNLDTIYSRISDTVTGITVNGANSMSGSVDFTNGTSINAIKDGALNAVSFNFVKGTGANAYLQESDIPRTNWNTAYNSNITGIGFESGSTADKIDINLITRDGSTADINVADILREGNGITMGADATGFLTLSVNTNTIATRTWVTGEITNNTITSASVNSGAAITGDLNFTDGTHISAIRDGATNNVSFNFDNSVAGFITQSTLNAFTGSSNITTLGTITSGTWQGSNIAAAYLPSTIPYTTANQSWGNFTLTAGDFILNSDRDLKENIIPLAKREIKVDFKEYNFKGSNRTRFGVIAQELEEHHPEFVHTRERGEKSVSYIDLLVAKIHELEGRIKELENGSRNG